MSNKKEIKKIIFYNGDIITMDDNNKFPEAILIKDDIIEKVGTKEEIMKFRDEGTELVDLQGKTLMPGFIDPHSHITAYAQTMATVSLRDCKSIEEVGDKILEYKNNKKITNEWIIGVGYDNNMLKERRHPNKFDLDSKVSDCPVIISHASGHMGVANSKALEILNINEKTQDEKGGKIGRVEGTEEPNGYLEENSFINRTGVIANQSIESRKKLLEEAQEDYLKNGITTCQDGLTKKQDWELLKATAENDELKIDVVSYIDIVDNKNIVEENKKYVKSYQNKLKIGGYKLILDGSPQGKTAWLTKPYEGEKEYRGYPTKTDKEVKEFVRTAVEEDMQLLTHCNGDAAGDQLINAYMNIQDTNKVKKTRPVLIHAQTARKDQIERCKELGMIPSYFVTHTYYWGDIHIKNLGERAYHISPVKTTINLDWIYTFHQDTPVILPNMLETIWSAVNRETMSGITIGEDEKVEVYEALKAITIYAAYQYFEEDTKGSIQEEKKADLVVLKENPLKVEKEKIKYIKVLQTWKNGKLLYEMN